jgi:hypothetical protein
LIEEHERGACLLRVRARLRPSFVGTLRGATAAVVAAGGASASMFIYDMGVTLLVSAVAIAAIGARAAWQVIRGAAVLNQAVGRVAAAAGFVELPVGEVEGVVEPNRPVESVVEPSRPVEAVAPAAPTSHAPSPRRPAEAPAARLQRHRMPAE